MTLCGAVMLVLAGTGIWVIYWLWTMGGNDDSSDD